MTVDSSILEPRTDPIAEKIGVCLSGGGFRAAFFGLGAVRYLVEAGNAPCIRAISAVSGGSLAAAMLADQWPAITDPVVRPEVAVDKFVLRRLTETVASKNLRNRGMLRFAAARARPGARYGSARGTTLVKHLLDCERLSDLPRDLQVVLTSTDLTSGRAFRMSQEFIGSWDLGYAPTPQSLGLATALAASTAVPLVFPPVHLKTEGLGIATLYKEMSLIDGGVYDNLGLEWFQGWRAGRPDTARQCDFVVCLDSSGPLDREDKRFGWLSSVRRSQAAQYQQSRTSRVRWFVDQLVNDRLRGVYVPITYDAGAFRPPEGIARVDGIAGGALPDGFAHELSRLRTDLDCFSRRESELLAYHGYWSMHVRLRTLRPDLATDSPKWRSYAATTPAQVDALRTELRTGRKFRANRRRSAV